ncbi:GTP-binding protein [Nitrosotalea devaniterrae]|uniref:GTP-binding protein n=1 Tax=Nitrosotalea devaniterrae TaxID=1078905 RepID=A0A128A114_9ARCH|nr:GTP-binding protein [Candidatus Nitrosotalea devanaterra]
MKLNTFGILIRAYARLFCMQIGLLGKTNVGKSTFFSAATQTTAQIGNYPFTTIEPNMGIAYVKTDCACKHFAISHIHPMCVNGTRYIAIKLIDVAGLVPGAHEGKGLGNKFLDDARTSEVLIHVVDASGSTDIQGQSVPAGTHDPLEDVKFVEEEFDQWMKQILQREWQKLARELESKSGKVIQAIAQRFSGLGIDEYDVEYVIHNLHLQSKKPNEWNEDDLVLFVKTLRKRTKPIIIAANKSDLCHDLSILDEFKKIHPTIACSAETELLLRKATKNGLIDYLPGEKSFKIKDGINLNPPQQKALELAEKVVSKLGGTGVQQTLDYACFDLLKLITVFPVEDETKLSNKNGEVLPDAKLLRLGATARDLAKSIHQDLAKGFLFAIDAKTKQRVGADHQLKNGDVLKIVSTLSRG